MRFQTIGKFLAVLIVVSGSPSMAEDGFSDLITVYRSGTEARLYSWLSAGNGFDHSLTWRQEPTFDPYGSAEVDWVSGDYDGDGKADVATIHRSGTQVKLYVWSSAGHQFNNWVKWQDTTSFNGYASTEVKWLSGDVDGDGKHDLITVYRSGTRVILYVWKSTGSGFSNWVKWRDIDTFGPYGSNEIDWLAGDVTGDGRADLVTVYRNNKRVILYVWKATSWDTFTGWSKWRDVNDFNSYNAGTEIKWLITDANGDGKNDIVTVYRSGTRAILYFWKSFGTGFNSWTKWQDTNTFNTLASTEVDWLAADIDGNGDGDIITVYRSGKRAILYAWVSMGSSFNSWSKWRDTDAFNSYDANEIKWLVADVGADLSTSYPIAGYGGLVEVEDDRTEDITSVQANTGYSTVYQTTVAANAGDLLRIHGQVEITNDIIPDTVARGSVRVQANGQTVGTVGESLVTHSDNHHMPLWADGYYEVPSSGNVVVTAQVSASTAGGNPGVVVEQGYGQVIVEQYRPYADGSAAASDGAQGLSHWALDESEDATTYGNMEYDKTIVYETGISVLPGDSVLLTGQVTTDYDTLEMQGQAINKDHLRISPWSTENNSQRSVRLPVYTMAVDKPTLATTQTYRVKVHGVIDGGNHPIHQGGGYLHGLVYRTDSSAQGLRSAIEGEALIESFASLSGPQRIGAVPVLSNSDTSLRITGAVQLSNDSSFMNQCESYIQVVDRSNTVVATSVSTRKYTNYDTDPVLLRTELLEAPGAGFHTVELWVECGWGLVDVNETGTRLRVERLD